MSKLDLTEATLQALRNEKLEESILSDTYNELDDQVNEEPVDTSKVDGIVDDVLIVTDPEVSSEEYDEIIERAQEIVDDTPEGELPFDEDYIGQYLITCPICGATFVSDEILEPGATCPVCLDVPEAFVVKGKLETDEEVAEKYKDILEPEENEVTDIPEAGEENNLEDDAESINASEEVKSADNKLQESETKEIITESEEFEVSELKKKAQEILPAEDIDTHDSDLYLRVSDKSTELLSHMINKDSGLLKKFKSQIDEDMWYDIPFANMEDDVKNKLKEDKELKTESINDYRLKIIDIVDKVKEDFENDRISAEDYEEFYQEAFSIIRNMANEEGIFVESKRVKKESLEQNEEDGWGEDIEEILDPCFEKVERLAYEIRNCRRGSYAGFGNTVSDLVEAVNEVQSMFEEASSELDNMKEQLQESDIREITQAEKILLDIIKSVNSNYELDDVVCETSDEGNIHIMTKDGKDICTVGREKFAINGDDTALIDELRDNGYWKSDLDESVTVNDMIKWHNEIEDAEDEDEIQEIIYRIDDGVLEDEVQRAYDQCIRDGDDLEVLKDFVISTLEDNAEYDE